MYSTQMYEYFDGSMHDELGSGRGVDLTLYVSEILHRDNNLFHIVKVMGADVLATQGARSTAAVILVMLHRNNSVPAR